jgi:phosphate transport system substrate-binding protein
MRILHFSSLLLCASALCGQSGVVLTGAGSTFAAPLYDKWIASFSSTHRGPTIKFKSVGSGAGLKLLEQKAVDFAAADFVPDNSYLQQVHVRTLPAAVGGLVAAYNLPGVNGEIRFTADILAGIYLGSITRWDDPRIKAINKQVKLPAAEIIPLHRSDVSGSTHIWTEFLSSNSEWKSKFDVNSVIQWPCGRAVEGNERMAQTIAKTPYSAGYVQFIDAIKEHLHFGAVENASREFVRADIDSLVAAATSLRLDSASVVNSPGRKAYPIASATWLIIPADMPEVKRKRMTEFLNWVLSSGQYEAAALGYIALPQKYAQDARMALQNLWSK